jgi:Tat protein translocase TatB subunit
MFGSIGMPELIIIFVIALIIFGPRKLPELGRSLRKTLAQLKRWSNELKSTLEEEIRLDEQRTAFEASKAANAAQAGTTAATTTTTIDPMAVPQVDEPVPVAARHADHSA